MYRCGLITRLWCLLHAAVRCALCTLVLGIAFAGFMAAPSAAVYAQAPGTTFSYEVYERDGLFPERYAERRRRVLLAMSDSAAAVFFSADIRNRQNDVDYEYRQSSDLLYLTGITTPGAKLLLVPRGIRFDGDTVLHHAVLFMPERKAASEVWVGVRPGPVEAERLLGAPKSLPESRWQGVLDTVLSKSTILYITQWPTASVVEPLFGGKVDVIKVAKAALEERYPHIGVKSQRSLLASLREIKDSDELQLLQKAVDITTAGFLETLRQARPGMAEYELESIMEHTFRRLGAHDVGYPSIVGSGPNTCLLHYTDNRRTTEKGDLVLMDCGAEYFGYTADITRTFPIKGTFSAEQRLLYNIVLEAQDSAIAACRPDNDWRKPHSRAVEVIRRRLLEEEIIKEPEQYLWYFMHGTSHYLGLDVHDAGSYGALRVGTVLTVEPGIYIPAGSPCDPKWWNIGIRIEDNVVVGETGPVVLSRALPRSVQDIERLLRAGR